MSLYTLLSFLSNFVIMGAVITLAYTLQQPLVLLLLSFLLTNVPFFQIQPQQNEDDSHIGFIDTNEK